MLMERAIALARSSESGAGKVSPKVGAVVVRDGVVVGEAFRGETAPGDHAEFTLLENELPYAALAGATLYTTLEHMHYAQPARRSRAPSESLRDGFAESSSACWIPTTRSVGAASSAFETRESRSLA
jgi:hypothetical protein